MDKILREFSLYIENDLKKSVNTRLSYERDLKFFLQWLKEQGIDSLGKVSEDNLTAYIAYLRSADKSSSTISRTMASLRKFFGFALSKGYIFSNPSQKLKAPKVIRKAPKVAQQSDIAKLVELPDGMTPKGMRDKAMLSLMIHTGLRVSEVNSLREDNVDFRKHQITVASANGRKRTVEMDAATVRYMKKYLQESRPRLLGEGSDEGCFFLNCKGGQMTRQGVWKMLKFYADAGDIEGEITPLILRHSFAVSSLREGRDVKELQSILGHSGVNSTAEYMHLM